MDRETHDYDDIIHLPRPVSVTRRPMPLSDRAAQFAPFAALTGFEAVISETERLTDRKPELDDEKKRDLNEKLLLLAGRQAARPTVTVTFFQKDDRKEGGALLRATGEVKKIDDIRKLVVFADGAEIPVEDIMEIESDAL